MEHHRLLVNLDVGAGLTQYSIQSKDLADSVDRNDSTRGRQDRPQRSL